MYVLYVCVAYVMFYAEISVSTALIIGKNCMEFGKRDAERGEVTPRKPTGLQTVQWHT